MSGTDLAYGIYYALAMPRPAPAPSTPFLSRLPSSGSLHPPLPGSPPPTRDHALFLVDLEIAEDELRISPGEPLLPTRGRCAVRY
eukprot:821488-Rhodomonas_salina.2